MPSTIGPCRATRAANAASPVASRRGHEPLDQLPVGEPGGRAALEERPSCRASLFIGPLSVVRGP